jgi:hypothetical protein
MGSLQMSLDALLVGHGQGRDNFDKCQDFFIQMPKYLWAGVKEYLKIEPCALILDASVLSLSTDPTG